MLSEGMQHSPWNRTQPQQIPLGDKGESEPDYFGTSGPCRGREKQIVRVCEEQLLLRTHAFISVFRGEHTIVNLGRFRHRLLTVLQLGTRCYHFYSTLRTYYRDVNSVVRVDSSAALPIEGVDDIFMSFQSDIGEVGLQLLNVAFVSLRSHNLLCRVSSLYAVSITHASAMVTVTG